MLDSKPRPCQICTSRLPIIQLGNWLYKKTQKNSISRKKSKGSNFHHVFLWMEPRLLVDTYREIDVALYY